MNIKFFLSVVLGVCVFVCVVAIAVLSFVGKPVHSALSGILGAFSSALIAILTKKKGE